MTATASLDQAEFVHLDGYVAVTVPVGTVVKISERWNATITQEGLDCDCNKGVLCPLNPQSPRTIVRS